MEDNPPILEIKLFENYSPVAFGWDSVHEVRMEFCCPYNMGRGTLPLGKVTDNPVELADGLANKIVEIFKPEETQIVVRNGSGDKISISPGEYIPPPLNGLLDKGLYRTILSTLKGKHQISFNEIP